ncbi:hypothetical protein TNCV_4290481 [Trichonephila clavipes]|nr:hypothetical protein TNCV_4290481 [Trichonephila clavipes]
MATQISPLHHIEKSSVKGLPNKKYVLFLLTREKSRTRLAYRDSELSFIKIGQDVARNQATVMRVCHHWIQDETMDQSGQSPLPSFTIARDDRRIVRMAVMDLAATSRIMAQHIQSVM